MSDPHQQVVSADAVDPETHEHGERTFLQRRLGHAAGGRDLGASRYELAPGKRIGRHTDGVDELLFVLAGTVEATVGDERATADAGTLAVVPAETPHSVRNVGDDPAQLVGVFATAPVASTWDTEPAVVDADEE